jgi:glycosyltransferase involved in cell wall biosynthesis
MNIPSISVVMTVYKPDIGLLACAFEGIMQQTFTDFELIVVLDDPTNEEVKIFFNTQNEPRLRFYVNENNEGYGFTLNKGIRLAQSAYIAIHHDDDVSHVTRFEKQYHFLQTNPKVDVLGTGIEYVDAFTQKSLYKRIYSNKIEKIIRKDSPVADPSLMIRKQTFDKFGFYDQQQGALAIDYALYLPWYIQGVHFYNLSEVLLTYYQGNNSSTKKVHQMIRAILKTKAKYHLKAKFGFSDYAFMFAQAMLLLLPGTWIRGLFYFLRTKKIY